MDMNIVVSNPFYFFSLNIKGEIMKEYPEVFQAITLNVAWCYRACSLYSKSSEFFLRKRYPKS